MAILIRSLDMMIGLAIIIFFYYLGSAIQGYFNLLIPGSVLGMLFLLLTLLFTNGANDSLALASDKLLHYLPLLLVPSCVSIITCRDYLASDYLALISILILGTLLSFFIIGVCLKVLPKI